MIKTLLYLIQISLFISLLLFLSKLLGIYLGAYLFDVRLEYSLGDLYSLINPTIDASYIVTIMSFADMVMFSILAIGSTVVVVQSAYFHDSHVDVALMSKLVHMNLLQLIKTTYVIYNWGFVFGLYLLIGSLVIFIDFFNGLVPLWMPLIAMIFSVMIILILVKDVYNEINIFRKKS